MIQIAQQGKRSRWAILFAGLFVGGLVLTHFASISEARPRILRPGTRAGEFEGGISGYFFLGNNFRGFGHGGGLVLQHTVGGHFSGDSSGPALGGDLDLYFGSGSDFGFLLGVRFWYDIPIARMAIYVAPFVRTGFLLLVGGSANPGMNIQFGVRLKVILNNRALFFLEPHTFSLRFLSWGGQFYFDANFLFSLGAGITF